MKELLVTVPKPVAAACSVFVPAASIRKFVNDTVPLPPAVPILRTVVPCNVPVPLATVTVTLFVAASPTVESFPNPS